MHRIAVFLGLPNSPQVYLDALDAPSPVQIDASSSLRVWYWLCISDCASIPFNDENPD